MLVGIHTFRIKLIIKNYLYYILTMPTIGTLLIVSQIIFCVYQLYDICYNSDPKIPGTP